MQTETLPKFKGIPLVPEELKDLFPEVGILGGDFGIEILERYNSKLKEEFQDIECLKAFLYDEKENVVIGSNVPGNVLLNEILEQYGCHIATQADLEAILKANLFDLKGSYKDTGLVLRSDGNPNGYFAKDLSQQLIDRKQLQYPVLIHLKDLTLRKDDESPLRVSFNIRKNADLIYDPILNQSGSFSSKDINQKTGLPLKLGKGNRRFYTRDSGLSLLYLNYNMDLSADSWNLAYSNNSYKVVVVSAEGAQKFSSFLDECRHNLEIERNK